MNEKLKILVVDDKKVIGDLFDFTLGYSGHKICVMDSANAALEILRSESFDVVFLDIVMPEQDGIDTLKNIKAIAPNLPIVMMSGYSVDEKRRKAEELGAIACLKKPFEMDDIKKVVKLATGKEI
ncbi:MAG: response regulator [Candidatus Omnitrophota bacterium]